MGADKLKPHLMTSRGAPLKAHRVLLDRRAWLRSGCVYISWCQVGYKMIYSSTALSVRALHPWTYALQLQHDDLSVCRRVCDVGILIITSLSPWHWKHVNSLPARLIPVSSPLHTQFHLDNRQTTLLKQTQLKSDISRLLACQRQSKRQEKLGLKGL